MKKFNKLLLAFFLLFIHLFSGCSEKEVPVPTVNTKRLDDLRNELRELQLQVYGEQWEMEDIATENASIEAQIAFIQAEIERLQVIYTKSVVYGIYIIDFQDNKLANATVKIAQNGEIITGTTNENGYVEFQQVRSGMVNGVVEIAGYTTANFTTRLTEYGTDDDTEVHKFSRIALFPRADNEEKTGMFILKGKVFTNFSELDEDGNHNGHDPNHPSGMHDPVVNKKLRFSLLLNNIKGNSSAFLNVHNIIYEGIQYETTTSSDGSYEVHLPSRGVFLLNQNGFEFGFLVQGEEFQADFTYRMGNDAVTERRNFSVDFYNDCYYYDLSPVSFPGDTKFVNFFYYSYKN